MLILPQTPLICKDIRGSVRSKMNSFVWAIQIKSFFAYSEKNFLTKGRGHGNIKMQRRAEKIFLLVTSPKLEYILYLWSILAVLYPRGRHWTDRPAARPAGHAQAGGLGMAQKN